MYYCSISVIFLGIFIWGISLVSVDLNMTRNHEVIQMTPFHTRLPLRQVMGRDVTREVHADRDVFTWCQGEKSDMLCIHSRRLDGESCHTVAMRLLECWTQPGEGDDTCFIGQKRPICATKAALWWTIQVHKHSADRSLIVTLWLQT